MTLYAKMDCALDMNPKIRKAGARGREVFLFLLRRNRLLDAHGFLPLINVDPDYLADQLMIDRNDALQGVTACCNALLVSVTAENVEILGWSDEWSREPKSNAKRQAEWRDKHKLNKQLPEKAKKRRNDPKVTNNESNVREEKRREEKNREEKNREEKNREEKRREEEGVPVPVEPGKAVALQEISSEVLVSPSSVCRDRWYEFFAEHNGGAKATWGEIPGRQLKRLLGSHSAEEICRRMENAFRYPPWPHEPPGNFAEFASKFDKYATANRGKAQTALGVAMKHATLEGF